MRKITKKNIGTVNPKEKIYAFSQRPEATCRMTYRNGKYCFLSQKHSGVSISWGPDYYDEYSCCVMLITRCINAGIPVYEFDNEVEYHEWALDQLTDTEKELSGDIDEEYFVELAANISVLQTEVRRIGTLMYEHNKQKEPNDELKKDIAGIMVTLDNVRRRLRDLEELARRTSRADYIRAIDRDQAPLVPESGDGNAAD